MECTHDCDGCGSVRGDDGGPGMLRKLNGRSSVKKVIGVISGKGGVGKSLVASLLAVSLRRLGYRTAILDADITGPSIPRSFGLHGRAGVSGDLLLPMVSGDGTEIMSINLLLDGETDPVVWRGPILAGAVTQFWTDCYWREIDFMIVDLPPGTGDVPLTVFQSLPVDGLVLVTTPQDLVSMIVEKAVRMAELLDIPVLGVVENMSRFVCPDCGKEHSLFGGSRLEETAARHGLPVLARLPVDPALAELMDTGRIERFEGDWMREAVGRIAELLPR